LLKVIEVSSAGQPMEPLGVKRKMTIFRTVPPYCGVPGAGVVGATVGAVGEGVVGDGEGVVGAGEGVVGAGEGVVGDGVGVVGVGSAQAGNRSAASRTKVNTKITRSFFFIFPTPL
jgi:hypothetical protein